MQNARLDEAQAGIKTAGRNINNLRYTDDTTLMAESEEELKSFLMKVKEESEKAGLKLNIQKTKIMASGPITSWQIEGETMETVTDFIFLGSKITADDDCSHEIKRHLLLGRKAMTNLDCVIKSRDITLPTKVHIVKAMVFPVVMYGCKSWTIKKFSSVAQSCPTCSNPIDRSLPGSSIHGIFQARVLEWGAIAFSNPYMTTGKTIALTMWTFVGKVMSLLFNMLSRLVITFFQGTRVF